MYDTGKVLIGVIIFAALFTSPIWLNLASGKGAKAPELVYPENAEACIYETEYINSYHMDVLNDWRDSLVREDIRYTVINGQKVEMSLSKTCMSCHNDKSIFCDRCHDYLDVNPYCWTCHVAPELSGIEDPNNINNIIKEFKKVHDCEKPCDKPCGKKHDSDEKNHHSGLDENDTPSENEQEVKHHE